VTAGRSTYDRFICLQTELEKSIPRNATVYTGNGRTLGSQILSEISASWAKTVAEPPDALWILQLTSSSGGCDGLNVKATAN
jgi:hypothetical protein